MRTRLAIYETGIPGLDIILGGGLSRDALIFLVGMPGAGKTVLGAQLLCNAAHRGERGLIITGFSEGHVKLLDHLASFSFFDQSFIGNELTLLSLQTIVGKDLDAAAAALIRTARQSDARLVLIDGLQTLRSLLPSHEDVMLLLAALANQLTYLDVTLIITIDGPPEQIHAVPELIMADVAISMEYSWQGWRRIRRLEVLKHRGYAQLNGSHTLQIGSDGITLYPRLEALSVPVGTGEAWTPTMIGFGMLELDRMLGGGLASGTTTIVLGPPGSGKTALSLHWAVNAGTPKTPTLYITFAETPERLRQRAGTYRLEIEAAIDQHAVNVMYISPTAADPDRLGDQLLSMIQTTAIRRVVIDDFNALTRSLGERAYDYIAALREWFQYLNVTALFTLQMSTQDDWSLDLHQTPYMPLAENIIVLQQRGDPHRLRRVLLVQKTALRGGDNTFRDIVLDGVGLRVLAASELASPVVPGDPADSEDSTSKRA